MGQMKNFSEVDAELNKVRKELEAKVQSVLQEATREDEEAKKRDEKIQKDVHDQLTALTGRMTAVQAQAQDALRSVAKPDDLKTVIQKVLALDARLAAIEARLAKVEAK